MSGEIPAYTGVEAYSLHTERGVAEYASYARQVVARAGAEYPVNPKLAHAFFDANAAERIDSVDVGAPRQMSEGLRDALQAVRDAITSTRRDGLSSEGATLAIAALDEIETAFSGQLVASFKWEPVQDPPIPGHVAHADDAQESPLVRLPFVCPDDVEDDNVIAQGGGWATFKRNGVWWVERVDERHRVSWVVLYDGAVTDEPEFMWLGQPCEDGAKSGPLTLEQYGVSGNNWRAVLDMDDDRITQSVYVAEGVRENIDARTRAWIRSLTELVPTW